MRVFKVYSGVGDECHQQKRGSTTKSTKMVEETYNTRDSLVVTHPTTSLAVTDLSMGERTGSRAFQCLWSYVTVGVVNGVQIGVGSQITSHHLLPSSHNYNLLRVRGTQSMAQLGPVFRHATDAYHRVPVLTFRPEDERHLKRRAPENHCYFVSNLRARQADATKSVLGDEETDLFMVFGLWRLKL